MKPSPHARALLHDERPVICTERRNKWARRLWPWLAIALVFGWAALDAWWVRAQTRQAEVERDQAYILSQERIDFMGELPSVVFVLEGKSVPEITDKLQRIETNSLMLRMSLRQGTNTNVR